ncbi:histidine phosphatase family protein [Erythrobacter sp. NE805]|uniref:histidine phosphatase family protein n=1 Tax=Erythrobacter sp. NE805 TaxID=3389875 RepID=UPI00396B0E93
MTATILLVRHGTTRDIGRVLTGRGGDLPLSEAGRSEVGALAARLAAGRLDALQTSPVRRARETAAAIGEAAGLAPLVASPLEEVDFGEWTGRSFADLAPDPGWQAWNSERADACPPGGETIGAVQARVLAHLREVARSAAGSVVAMVSHADVIRACVAGIIGLSLSRILALTIDPASVTRIEAGEWGERLVTLNERSA